MAVEESTDEGVLLACMKPECGRRVVVKRAGGLVVLDRGDFFALHTGGNLTISTSVQE
jgi:hypothetical protein